MVWFARKISLKSKSFHHKGASNISPSSVILKSTSIIIISACDILCFGRCCFEIGSRWINPTRHHPPCDQEGAKASFETDNVAADLT